MAFFLRVPARALAICPAGHRTDLFCSKNVMTNRTGSEFATFPAFPCVRQSLGSGAVPCLFEHEQEHEHEERISAPILRRRY